MSSRSARPAGTSVSSVCNTNITQQVTLHVSVAVQARFSFFRNVAQRVMVTPYRRFGTVYRAPPSRVTLVKVVPKRRHLPNQAKQRCTTSPEEQQSHCTAIRGVQQSDYRCFLYVRPTNRPTSSKDAGRPSCSALGTPLPLSHLTFYRSTLEMTRNTSNRTRGKEIKVRNVTHDRSNFVLLREILQANLQLRSGLLRPKLTAQGSSKHITKRRFSLPLLRQRQVKVFQRRLFYSRHD